MRRKFADYPNWKNVEEKKLITKYFNNTDFKGNISLLTAVKVSQKAIKEKNGKNVVVCDNNFKLLEIYPETNKNVSVIVSFTDKDEIIDWFFDIAENSSITDDGIPYIDDLYLDIILSPTGELKLVDEDELQAALDNKDISKKQFDLAYAVANKLIDDLNGNLTKLTDFTNKYYSLINA